MSLDKEEALKRLAAAEHEVKELRKIIENASVIDPKNLPDYPAFCKVLGVDSAESSIKLDVPGFDAGQIKFLHAIIKDMRIKEVYNGAKKLTCKDKRWYDWFRFSSGAGLVFHCSTYDVDYAHTGSAARLALKSEQDLIDYRKKFQYIQEAIIDLPE